MTAAVRNALRLVDEETCVIRGANLKTSLVAFLSWSLAFLAPHAVLDSSSANQHTSVLIMTRHFRQVAEKSVHGLFSNLQETRSYQI